MECCVQFHLTRLLGLTLHCTYLSLPYLNMYVYKYILIIILICSSILPCWPVGPSQQLLLVFGCECIMSNRPWTPKHCTGCSHCTTRASGSSLHTFTIPFMSTSAKIFKVYSWFSCVTANSTELFLLGALDEDIGHPAPHKPYWTNIRGSFFVDGPGQWLCTANVSFFQTPTSKIKAGKGGVYGILLFILLQFMDERWWKCL